MGGNHGDIPNGSFDLVLHLAFPVISQLNGTGRAAGSAHAASLARSFVHHRNAVIIYFNCSKWTIALAPVAPDALLVIDRGGYELELKSPRVDERRGISRGREGG